MTFEEQIEYAVRTMGGLKSTLFSGKGLVAELTGPLHDAEPQPGRLSVVADP